MTKPLLIIVGADKGGVGKTTVSKLLCDYMSSLGVKYEAWDTEHPAGILHRFYPNSSKVVDLTKSVGQMQVLDNLTTNAVSIIDIRAGLLSPSVQMLADTGLLRMTDSGAIDIAIVHVLGPTISSLEEIKTAAGIISTAKHFLVKNYITQATFFDFDPEKAKLLSDLRSGLITIEHLDDYAQEHVESAGVPYDKFVMNLDIYGMPAEKSYSLVLRGYVNSWMEKAYNEFNTVGLKDLIKSGVS